MSSLVLSPTRCPASVADSGCKFSAANLRRMRVALALQCLFFLCATPIFACECGAPGHASKYVKNASVVFVGRVAFTNDDGTGTFRQKTLIGFEVQEAYKGVPSGVHDVWIDPGSCTTCYAEYRVGHRYLVFGYGGAVMPTDSAAMSTSEQCRSKPLPPQIDREHLPTIYEAPECAGTREITPETEHAVTRELRYLAKFRAKMQKKKT